MGYIACQTSLSMEFFRQKYWSWLPFLPSGYLLDTGIEPTLPASPALRGGFFTTAPHGKPEILIDIYKYYVLIYFLREIESLWMANFK